MTVNVENDKIIIEFQKTDWFDRRGGAKCIISGIKTNIPREQRHYDEAKRRWFIDYKPIHLKTLEILQKEYLSSPAKGHFSARINQKRIP